MISTALLRTTQAETAAVNRRAEASARRTCDYCGKPFAYGYSGLGIGSGGGWRHQHVTVRVGGRWHVVCSERCRERLSGYVQRRRGRVPRLIGRETVRDVLQSTYAPRGTTGR